MEATNRCWSLRHGLERAGGRTAIERWHDVAGPNPARDSVQDASSTVIGSAPRDSLLRQEG